MIRTESEQAALDKAIYGHRMNCPCGRCEEAREEGNHELGCPCYQCPQ